MDDRDDASGIRIRKTLTVGDLERSGGVIDEGNVDAGWDDADSGEFLPCGAAFAQ